MLGPLENALYRLAGIKPQSEQSWLQYTVSLSFFHALAILMLYALLRLQSVLPLNPQDLASVSPDLALNTAVSFVTNTSWQSYGGETTLSYVTRWSASPFTHSCPLRPASPSPSR
jgi:potassium-transporting ATPase potassium-binding subunit